MNTFKSLGLEEPILKALEKEGYKTPTPIEQRAIPLVLDGRDLLGCAQTGTGKTAAFALPIIQSLHLNQHKLQAESPLEHWYSLQRESSPYRWREFCCLWKICRTKAYSHFWWSKSESPSACITSRNRHFGSNSRTIDRSYQSKTCYLGGLQIFVLDEADRMLDMGFVHDVKRIIALLPAKRQSLFFSATMPPVIQKLRIPF